MKTPAKLFLIFICLMPLSFMFGQELVCATRIDLHQKKHKRNNWKFFKTYTINTYSDRTIDASEDFLSLFSKTDYRFQVSIDYKGQLVDPNSNLYKFSAKIDGREISPILKKVSATTKYYQFDYSFDEEYSTTLNLGIQFYQDKEIHIPVFSSIKKPVEAYASCRTCYPAFISLPKYPIIKLFIAEENGSPINMNNNTTTIKANVNYLFEINIVENREIEIDAWQENQKYSVSNNLEGNDLPNSFYIKKHPKSSRAFYLMVDQSFPKERALIVPLKITLKNNDKNNTKTFEYQIIVKN